MKINKIFIGGLAVLSLTACNDFLDVDPASNAVSKELVYNSASEVDKALNGVYASLLSSETFGKNLYTTFQLNSDVDFVTKTQETAAGNLPQRFDTRADAGNVNKLWNNLYAGVETCNEFINGLEDSKIYAQNMKSVIEGGENGGATTTTEVPDVTDLTQKMGEAKVIRAMFYHELLSYWGDIPFTFEGTGKTGNLLPPVTERQKVSDALIKDLEEAAKWMKSDQDATLNAPERISQEACYAMIARLALQAGGYSLNHDAGDTKNYKMTRPDNYKDYYQIARDYAKKVIVAGGHALTKSYRQVFIDECNFITTKGDDPIFEIPFTKEYSGAWGYSQGPKSEVDINDDVDYNNSTWGKCNADARVSRFYGYMFADGDARRDYTIGLWGYSNKGVPTINIDYTMYNNKWSKLWNTVGLGKSTTDNTGINFAYLRYADVLLMFAEAENEVNNGPTQDAINAVEQVRKRAFENGGDYHLTSAQTDSKEHFLKAVLDERKFEFAGENMRWKDLVRNNLYSETLFYTFMSYYAVAESANGSTQFMDLVDGHDGVSYNDISGTMDFYYFLVKDNEGDVNFPNNNLYKLYISSPWAPSGGSETNTQPDKYLEAQGLTTRYTAVTKNSISGKDSDSKKLAWETKSYEWANLSSGMIKNEVLYSLFGFVRGDENGSILIVNNSGASTIFNVDAGNMENNLNRLSAVRYLLPYPQEAISRSNNVYKNYYGF